MARRPRTIQLPGTSTLPTLYKPYAGAIAETSTHKPPDVLVPALRGRNWNLFNDPYWKASSAPMVTLAVPATAVMAPSLHVLIASVPWRRASLNRLIRDVAAQTVLPAYVHLVLDGDGAPNAVLDTLPLTQKGIQVTVREQHPGRGAGSRWEVVDDIPDTDIVCNLDDDVGLYTNNYLSTHYAALQSAQAVCAGGYTPEGRFIMCNKLGIDYEGPINCFQAGAFSARAVHFRGLRSMPMANEMLGMMGDDEGIIAAHFWKTGVVVRRVISPVSFDPSGSDPRSQFLNMPGRITRLRNRLRALTGWPWGNV